MHKLIDAFAKAFSEENMQIQALAENNNDEKDLEVLPESEIEEVVEEAPEPVTVTDVELNILQLGSILYSALSQNNNNENKEEKVTEEEIKVEEPVSDVITKVPEMVVEQPVEEVKPIEPVEYDVKKASQLIENSFSRIAALLKKAKRERDGLPEEYDPILEAPLDEINPVTPELQAEEPNTVNADVNNTNELINNYVDIIDQLDKAKEANPAAPGAPAKAIDSKVLEYINEQVNRLRIQISHAMESGGGTTAVQYQNGGTMNGNLTVNGNVTTDSIQFNVNAGVAVGQGQIAWNSAENCLDVGTSNNISLQVGQEMLVQVKADEAISTGMIVYATGAYGGGSGNISAAKWAANRSFPDDLFALGIASEDFAANDIGFITTQGKVRQVRINDVKDPADPSSWPIGTILYASPNVPGNLTSIKPVTPNHPIAIVMILGVNGNFRTFYVRYEHGFDLGELHDVRIASPSAGDVLTYNSLSGFWYNQQPSSSGATTGTGSPQSVVTASPGAFYWDTTGQSLWIKNSGTGNTGWVQLIA